ncbi:hypothetical protein EUBVEN_01666 [Eubacterium ventriosum ATCC 27560]|uniref:Uncharacterized protein n=1 Tax=Eubacterium ventriosum ATCC 27560 TaxID=411463 RepID=A5Z7I1_9FIRM|nr:hypothetical protein EUBVEN_01666 [Eubacterium ventriosum ATCC 27560]
MHTTIASAIVTASNTIDKKYFAYETAVWLTILFPLTVENAIAPKGTKISIFRNLKYTVYIRKNPHTMMTMESIDASISITRLEPKPRFFIISACPLSMVSSAISPAPTSFTRLPAEVKNAFIIVTLFATSHSAIPILISIRRITSNLMSSFTSTLSEQKPITKNSTTSEEPTPTKIGSRFCITPHGPPLLKLTGDCPKRANTSDI